jgi:hypothetical protein
MKEKTTKSGEKIIYLPSEANKDLGLFLIFIGIIAVPPCYWLYYYYNSVPVTDWKPSLFIGIFWVLAGLSLIYFSRKTITVGKSHIRINDGLFRKSFTIRWKLDPMIKLKYDEEEFKGRILEFWETSLLDGKLEYTIDRRAHHQLEARALGENIAKFLSCSFIERDEQGKESILDSKDLDMPFRCRAAKYPGFLGSPVDQPKNPRLTITERNKAFLVTWGIYSTGILVDIIAFAVIIFLFTYLPWKQGTHSFFEQCAIRGEFFAFYAGGLILFMTVFFVLGYRLRLNVSRRGAIFWVTIWGIPLRKRKIGIDKIEEIRLTPSMRGPRVQIISDREIISFRLFDKQGARWLSYQLQHYMLDNVDSLACPPPQNP